MNTTTFTASFTFPTDSIVGFGQYMKYQNIIGVNKKDADGNVLPYEFEFIPNPESLFDYIARLAKAHNEKFVTQWANTLVNEQVKAQITPIQTAMEAQIIQPVKDAVQVTYTSN